MHREQFLDMTKYSQHLEAYKTLLKKMLLLLGAEQNKVEVLVEDVVEFEIQLANVSFGNLIINQFIFYNCTIQ